MDELQVIVGVCSFTEGWPRVTTKWVAGSAMDGQRMLVPATTEGMARPWTVDVDVAPATSLVTADAGAGCGWNRTMAAAALYKAAFRGVVAYRSHYACTVGAV
ncbi:hypothetical protein NL676_011910 [Syzygium grande]|nr:hypothetical protein NL676_011910 [Syzygium grande]